MFRRWLYSRDRHSSVGTCCVRFWIREREGERDGGIEEEEKGEGGGRRGRKDREKLSDVVICPLDLGNSHKLRAAAFGNCIPLMLFSH